MQKIKSKFQFEKEKLLWANVTITLNNTATLWTRAADDASFSLADGACDVTSYIWHSPGRRFGADGPVVVFTGRRVELLSVSEREVEVMAPVSNPDKDLHGPDGGECSLSVEFGGPKVLFEGLAENAANVS